MYPTMYLVLLCHSMDDFPLLLTDDEKMARDLAESASPDVPESIADLFKVDANTPVCTKIVTFRLGRPVEVEVVKEFA